MGGFLLGMFQISSARAEQCTNNDVPTAAVAAGVVQLGNGGSGKCIPLSDIVRNEKKRQAILDCLQSYRGTETPADGNYVTLDDLIWCEIQRKGYSEDW
jgi:hypothetical protein